MTEPLHTGGMIALVPADSSLVALTVPGGDPPTELHLTLVYLGEDITQWEPEQRKAVLDIAHCMVDYDFAQQQARARALTNGEDYSPPTPSDTYLEAGQRGPLAANIFAHAVFNPGATEDKPGPDEPATVYLLDGDGDRTRIEAMQSDACYRIRDAIGTIDFPQQHSPFVPHVTAGYSLPIESLTYTGPVTFDRIRVALGDDVTDFPMVTSEESMTDTITADANPGDLSPEALDAAVTDGVPVTFPVLAVEGLATSDHRYIEPGALSHRALPIPVLAQVTNGGQGGHSGAAVVGKIAEMARLPGPEVTDKETGEPFPEGTFVWSGKGELHPDAEATDLARRGYLTGNSIDLSDMDAEYEMNYGEAGDDRDAMADGVERLVVHGGKIAATTLVPIPAFAQAYVVLDGQELSPTATGDDLQALSQEEFERRFAAAPQDEPDRVAEYLGEGMRRMGVQVVTASGWRSSEVGDKGCLLCELVASAEAFDDDGYAAKDVPDAVKRAKALKKGNAMLPEKGQSDGKARYQIENGDDLDNAIKAVGRGNGDHDAIRKHIMKVAKKLGLGDKIPGNWQPDGSVKATMAAGPPEFPSLADFSDPKLTGPTALTVTDDGRVYGHIATWGTCHIGFAGQCVTPPRNRSGYAYFATGAVRARDEAGELRTVAVGHLTMGTGHASTKLSAVEAVAHYDNTGTTAADVAAGDDQFGIWVAGRVVPGADVARLRAHAMSGDWRPMNGRLELVAALGVNVAGFPVPRARVASGEVQALVAAGAVMPEEKAEPTALEINYNALADAITARMRETGALPVDHELTFVNSDLEMQRTLALRDLALASSPFGSAR